MSTITETSPSPGAARWRTVWNHHQVQAVVLNGTVMAVAFITVLWTYEFWRGLTDRFAGDHKWADAAVMVVVLVIVSMARLVLERVLAGKAPPGFSVTEPLAPSASSREADLRELAAYRAEADRTRALLRKRAPWLLDATDSGPLGIRIDLLAMIPQASPTTSHAEESERAGRILHILGNHLEGVTTRTETAASTILGDLDSIHCHVEELHRTILRSHERTRDVLGDDGLDADQDTVVADLEEGFEETLGSLERGRAKVVRLSTEADSLTNMVRLLDTISRQSNILAINAAIEAERVGEAGRGFALVAKEVRQLSIQSAEATATIDHRVKAMKVAVQEVVDELSTDEHLRRGREILDGLRERVHGLSEEHLRLMAIQTDLITEAGDLADVIKTETIRSIGGIQFQDIIRQKVELVQGVLEDLARVEEAAAASTELNGWPDGRLAAFDQLLRDIQDRYVMDEQRARHAGVTGDSAPVAVVGAIELF